MRAILVLVTLIGLISSSMGVGRKFPDDFKFGVATASYQVEGAWNEDGKGENIWDHVCHEDPTFVDNSENGDIACDSYHKWQEDVAILKELGVDYYRLSLSWSRILPTGRADEVNEKGVEYYQNLIQALLDEGIEPLVTIYHWDLPQPLQENGGWVNESIVGLYAEYAQVCFEQFGPLVKSWLTFNEPKQTCQQGYGIGTMAPGIHSSGQDEYQCVHNLIKAHATAYHLYDDEFRDEQEGRVSITIDSVWYEPASDSEQDQEAAERALQFEYGLYANPIYNRNYPEVVINRVAERSAAEGYEKSRLPEFTEEELDFISGTYDYMGVNHYTTRLTEYVEDAPIGTVSFDNDVSVSTYQDPSWGGSASSWLKVYPMGIHMLGMWLKKTYNDPEIFITENGFSDTGELDDQGRIDYYQGYLNHLLEAMLDNDVNVTHYTAWSLMDNFEWARGYSEKFGLYQVNFDSPNRTRTPKASATWYADVVKTHCVYDDGCPSKSYL